MANHVSTYIEFFNEDEKFDEYFAEIIEQEKKRVEALPKNEDNPFANTIFGDTITGMMSAFGIEVPDEEGQDRNWFIDNVGAKWCYLEDVGESYVSTTSAWSVPFDFAAAMCKKLNEKFPNTFAVLSYEDEAYNFVGVGVVDESGVDEVEELDSDEVWETFAEQTDNVVPEDGIWDNDDLIDQFYDWLPDWLGNTASTQKQYYEEYLVNIKEEEAAELLDKENLSGC